MKVAETDADGLARPSVRQRPHTCAKEQLNGVLGDGTGDADAPFQVFAEVRGGDYLGYHRWGSIPIPTIHCPAREGRDLASGRQHLVWVPDPVRGT